ncbi:MAG: TraB/GumN family protein [Kangiellaceae bacterium]|nr:TraB/GumN family protein [Kangiellaceae bacterium]
MSKAVKIVVITLAIILGLLTYFGFPGFIHGIKDGWKENCYTCEKETPKANEEKQAESQASTSEESSAPLETKEVAYTPAIWKIEHNGKTSYLFGSIHGGDKSMYPLPEHITNAFNESEVLAVEIDLSKVNQMEMAQMVQTLAIDFENPLPTVLSEKTKQEFDKYCETAKNVCNMVNNFEPWMAAMTVEAFEFTKAGYSENYGIDKHFVSNAEGKEIVELESLGSQLNMLDQMPVALQDLMLLGAVSKEGDDFSELMTAWKTGNIEQVLVQAEQESKELGIDPVLLEQLNEIFLYQRNQAMADGIAEVIVSGKSIFAVVGALHYAGEKSVNHYLEEKGFKVERL